MEITNPWIKNKSILEKIYQEIMKNKDSYQLLTGTFIGIPSEVMEKLRNKELTNLTELQMKQLRTVLGRINATVTEEEFKGNLLARVLFIGSYGTFSLEKDLLKGTYQDEEIDYQLEIRMDKGFIKYVSTTKDKKLEGILCHLSKTQSHIKYTEVEEKKIKDPNQTEELTTINKRENLEMYEKGIEISKINKQLTEIYKVTKETGKRKTINSYLHRESYWRTEEGYIIQKNEHGVFDQLTDDLKIEEQYYIAKNKNEKANKIPFEGFYSGIDKELVEAYFNKEMTIKEILEQRQLEKAKNKVKIKK